MQSVNRVEKFLEEIAGIMLATFTTDSLCFHGIISSQPHGVESRCLTLDHPLFVIAGRIFSVGYYGRTNSNDYQKYNDSLPSGRNSVPGCRAAAAAKRHHEGSCNEDDDGDTGFPGDGLASSLSASGPSIQPRSAGSWHHPLKEH